MNRELILTSNAALAGYADWQGRKAGDARFLEFFTVNIRNPNTRAAYGRAARGFLVWCEDCGILELQHIQPVHVLCI